LPRDDGLVVPIRALHEPHGDALPLGARPVDHVAQIGLGVLEVSLHREAALRAIGELRLGENRFEEAQREVLHRVALHVHADEGAEFLRAAQHGAEALAELRDGGVGIGRVNLRVEGGELHGDVQARDFAARRDVALAGAAPLRRLAGEQVHEREIAGGVFVGLLLADDRFAEHVHRERGVLLVELLEDADDLLLVAAEHEHARHAADLRLDAAAEQAAGEAAGLERGAEGGVQVHLVVVEVFLEMPRDLARRLERRQHVHEAEELDLERLVLHRPIHHGRVQALHGEDGGAAGLFDAIEDLVAELNILTRLGGFDPGFDYFRGWRTRIGQ
jgi:hypothetical protein